MAITIPKQLQDDKFRFIKIRKDTLKLPLEKEWQTKNNYTFDDPDFVEYLKDAKGYGVLCGKGNLAVIDADTKEVENAVANGLPKTFVTETGSGGMHFYYIIPDLENKIVLQIGEKKNRKHYGEVQSTGSQVIGSGSLHPSGNKYKIKINADIAKITKAELQGVLADFIEDKTAKWDGDSETPISAIAGEITGLKRCGKELQGSHPIHGSEGGMNFTINTEKNLWHCFRCNAGGDALSLVAVMEKIITCSEAKNGLQKGKFVKTIKIAKEKYGIEPVKKDKRHYLDLSNPPKNLAEVYKRLSKWLYITDTYRIDLILATVISNQARETKPLWIFTVGQSGDGKSEIVGALMDYPDVIFIDKITANTMATGKTHKGKKVPDMGEELQDSSHILIFSDLATLKSVNKDEKNEIWGQFRELYDGKINKRTGNDTKAIYKNCHVTLMACTTPDIKEEYAIHNQLGTREFCYDIESHQEDDDEKMDRALSHMEQESIMKKDLREIIQSFLNNRKFKKDMEIDADIGQWIKDRCKELALFRATASFETRTGELRGYASREVPTRLVQQFTLLYKSLKSIESDYSDDRFKHIITNIVKATGDPIRQRIYYFLKDKPDIEYNVKSLHEQLIVGSRTLKRQCEVLTAMKILKRVIRTEYYGANSNLERDTRYYSFVTRKEIIQSRI